MKNYLWLCLVSLAPGPALAAGQVVFGIPYDGVVPNTNNPIKVNSSGQVELSLLACEDQTNGRCNVTPGPFEVEEVAASATDQTMGATGALGDYLEGCMVTVVTAATATFGIEDGTNTAFDNITVIVGAATLVGGAPIWVPVGSQATTSAGWEITTGAGATAYCRGYFT